MTASDLAAAVRPVAETLDALGVAFYLTGSVASSAHGIARASLDANIVADLQAEHVDRLIERLGSAYYILTNRLREAVGARSSCNLIHLATMFKVDHRGRSRIIHQSRVASQGGLRCRSRAQRDGRFSQVLSSSPHLQRRQAPDNPRIRNQPSSPIRIVLWRVGRRSLRT